MLFKGNFTEKPTKPFSNFYFFYQLRFRLLKFPNHVRSLPWTRSTVRSGTRIARASVPKTERGTENRKPPGPRHSLNRTIFTAPIYLSLIPCSVVLFCFTPFPCRPLSGRLALTRSAVLNSFVPAFITPNPGPASPHKSAQRPRGFRGGYVVLPG